MGVTLLHSIARVIRPLIRKPGVIPAGLALLAVSALGLTVALSASNARSSVASGGPDGAQAGSARAATRTVKNTKRTPVPTATSTPVPSTAVSVPPSAPPTKTPAPATATATAVAPTATAKAPTATSPSATATVPLAPSPTPTPTAAPLTSSRILFGLGPEADSAKASPLNQSHPLGMYSSWYNGTKDLSWMQYWYTSGFIRNSIYGTGRAANLIIWADAPNATTPVCGRPYPVSTQILDDMKQLATYWAGPASGPPLYVTLFTEFQTYPCVEDQWSGAEDYYAVLKQRMIQIRDIFHQYAPNSRVSIGWGGWQMRWDDPAHGGGASLIPYFADVMSQMDFQSTQLMNNDTNVRDAEQMIDVLGQYGPVMVAHYKPENSDDATFYADVSTIMTDSFLGNLVAHGLFAWSFMDQSNFNDLADPGEAANYNLVSNVVSTFGKAP